jgi:hypothetical protein
MMRPIDPPVVDYRGTPPAEWPQSECGGVSVVLGFTIVFFVFCVGLLHVAFVAREASAGRMLLRIEAGIFATLAGIGFVLALIGLRQRERRHSAAVGGLVINLLLLAISALVFLLA